MHFVTLFLEHTKKKKKKLGDKERRKDSISEAWTVNPIEETKDGRVKRKERDK